MVEGRRVRGSPLLQVILVVIVFVLAGVPVWRLTRPAAMETTTVTDVGTPAADASAAKPIPLEVEAVFSSPPTDFQIKNLDQTVLAGHGPETKFASTWTANVPAEGVDLVVQAHWTAPAGASAARVTVRFPDGRQAERSFWAAANGALTEVFTVPGAPPAS